MMINDMLYFISLSSVISLLLSFPVIKFLYKLKIFRLIDADFSTIIEERRLKRGTPIMGGLIIVLSLLFINLIYNFNGSTKLPLLVFSISAVLGAFDDILNIYGRERPVRSIKRTLLLAKVHANILMRIFYIVTLPWAVFKWIFYLLGSNPGKGIQAHEKIIIQIIIGSLIAWWIYFKSGWTNPGIIWLPFVNDINLGIYIIPVIILTVIIMTNSVNFTDGMDGLAAGLLLFSFFGFMIVSYLLGDKTNTILSSTAIGSLLIYLYFNIPPARFQMGDVGSLALGTLIATIGFSLDRAILIPIFGFLFILEFATTVIQGIGRRLLGRRIFKMAPLHHHFEMIGWSESKIVMRAWVLAPFLVIIGIWLSQF
jgi:phospho-N-acetylmuramoyl-pentapeptide-transferase